MSLINISNTELLSTRSATGDRTSHIARPVVLCQLLFAPSHLFSQTTVAEKWDTHIVNARLQELPRLESRPHLQHAKVALPDHPSPTLRAQLPQDRQRAGQQIDVRVELASNALEEQDRDDDIDKIPLHAHVVQAHHAQHLAEDIADLHVPQRQRPRFDAQHQVLHLQGEDLLVAHGVGLAAALAHQVPRAVAVELGDGLEEVEEVAAVGRVELRHEARVDEDQLRPVALGVDGGQLGDPARLVLLLPEGAEARQHGLGGVGLPHGQGVGGVGEGQVRLRGLVEAHHDVSRVQVRVHEVVDQEHAQKGVEPLVCEVGLEDAAAVLHEVRERDALRELLDEDLPCREGGVGVGERGGGAGGEVPPEEEKVGGFDAEIELEAHHGGELGDFVWEGEPFDGGDYVEDGGKEAHDA